MKSLLITLSLISAIYSGINSQCSTLIQMVDVGVEGCVLPMIVETSEILLPCSAPPEFNKLEEDDFGYIDFIDTSCINICQLGRNVHITCFSFAVSTTNEEPGNLFIFPNPVESFIEIRGEEINYLRLYNNCGILIAELQQENIKGFDMANQTSGTYILQLFTKTKVYLRRFIKL